MQKIELKNSFVTYKDILKYILILSVEFYNTQDISTQL